MSLLNAEIDFSLEEMEKIERCEKTQFRRPCSPDLFFVDNGNSGQVEPCRGIGGVDENGNIYGAGLFMVDCKLGQIIFCSKNPRTTIQITQIYVQKIKDMQPEEIKSEGFDSMESFLGEWRHVYGFCNTEERIVVYCFRKIDAAITISQKEMAGLCLEMQNLFIPYSLELLEKPDINDVWPSFTLSTNDCIFLIDRVQRTVPIDFYTMILAVKQTIADKSKNHVYGILLTRNKINFRSKFLRLWQKRYISFLTCDELPGFIKEKLQTGS